MRNQVHDVEILSEGQWKYHHSFVAFKDRDPRELNDFVMEHHLPEGYAPHQVRHRLNPAKTRRDLYNAWQAHMQHKQRNRE